MGSDAPSNQTTTAVPWGPQGDQLKVLLEQAQALFQAGPPEQFPGSGVAPQTPDQLRAQGAARSNVKSLDKQATAAQTSNQSLFNASDVGNNPVVQRAIQSALNPLARQFTTQVLPNLKIGGINSGGSSSSRQGVLEANATNDFNQVSSDLVGSMMGNFYGQGLDAQTRALSLAPELAGMTNMGAQNLAAVGDSNQIFAQQVLSDEKQKFDIAQNAQLTNLANFRNMITGGFGGTTTSPTGVQNPSQFGQAVGTGIATFGATGNPWLAGGSALASFL